MGLSRQLTSPSSYTYLSSYSSTSSVKNSSPLISSSGYSSSNTFWTFLAVFAYTVKVRPLIFTTVPTGYDLNSPETFSAVDLLLSPVISDLLISKWFSINSSGRKYSSIRVFYLFSLKSKSRNRFRSYWSWCSWICSNIVAAAAVHLRFMGLPSALIWLHIYDFGVT